MIHPRCVIKPVYVMQFTVSHGLRVHIFRQQVSALYESTSGPSS